jgi:hypothetical protein
MCHLSRVLTRLIQHIQVLINIQLSFYYHVISVANLVLKLFKPNPKNSQIETCLQKYDKKALMFD